MKSNLAALCLCVSAVCGTPTSIDAAQQLLDKVVARVAGTAITQTDVEAAIALGVVEADGPDRLAAGTRQMIERHLMLLEVVRFPPADLSEQAISQQVAAMKARAGAGYDALLRRTGLDEQRVRELARDTLRIRAYIEQRFGATQVSLQEAREYYERNRQEFARNGVVPPFDQVESSAREAAAAQRRRATIAQWIADLRMRGDVIDFTSRP